MVGGIYHNLSCTLLVHGGVQVLEWSQIVVSRILYRADNSLQCGVQLQDIAEDHVHSVIYTTMGFVGNPQGVWWRIIDVFKGYNKALKQLCGHRGQGEGSVVTGSCGVPLFGFGLEAVSPASEFIRDQVLSFV